jgi:hypothetical protein
MKRSTSQEHSAWTLMPDLAFCVACAVFNSGEQ